MHHKTNHPYEGIPMIIVFSVEEAAPNVQEGLADLSVMFAASSGERHGDTLWLRVLIQCEP